MATYVVNDINEELNISDSSHASVIYRSVINDGINFNENQDAFNSPYIKRLNDLLLMDDDSNMIGVYRPKIKNNLIINDNVNPRLILHIKHSDGIHINNISKSAVYFGTPLISSSNLSLSDNCKILVSRIEPWTFNNSLVAGIGTTETLLYKCTKGTSELINMSFCNVTSDPLTFSLSLYKGGTTEFHMIRDINLNRGESFVINNVKDMVTSIEKDDEIRATSSTVDSIDAYIAILEKKQG